MKLFREVLMELQPAYSGKAEGRRLQNWHLEIGAGHSIRSELRIG